jgi:hypothetical protein
VGGGWGGGWGVRRRATRTSTTPTVHTGSPLFSHGITALCQQHSTVTHQPTHLSVPPHLLRHNVDRHTSSAQEPQSLPRFHETKDGTRLGSDSEMFGSEALLPNELHTFELAFSCLFGEAWEKLISRLRLRGVRADCVGQADGVRAGEALLWPTSLLSMRGSLSGGRYVRWHTVLGNLTKLCTTHTLTLTHTHTREVWSVASSVRVLVVDAVMCVDDLCAPPLVYCSTHTHTHCTHPHTFTRTHTHSCTHTHTLSPNFTPALCGLGGNSQHVPNCQSDTGVE